MTLTVYALDSAKPILIQNPMALTIERDVFYIYPYIGDIAGSTPVEINSPSWAVVFKPEIGYMAKVEQVTFMTMNVDEAKLIIDGVTYTVS